MVWKNYTSKDLMEKYEKASDELRFINPHVMEDIEDSIIRRSINTDTREGKQELSIEIGFN